MLDKSTLSTDDILALDQAHVWHPYAAFPNPAPVYPVSHAEGVRLHLTDGRQLIDGTASWWSVLHGYNHPVLNKAVENQLAKVAHVMLGGLTHEPVARLAKQLVDITPDGLNKVFFFRFRFGRHRNCAEDGSAILVCPRPAPTHPIPGVAERLSRRHLRRHVRM